jgi:uncharacterized protein (TIGR00369 family)
MLMEDELPAKPARASRISLAIITEPRQANAFGTLHGGVLLRLADECGAVSALRHAGRGQITTAAIDSMVFLEPVYVGERVEICAEVTYVGRTSIETRIEIFAEPFDQPQRRRVAVGYGLYVALDESGRRPRPVAPLLIETEADRRRQEAARARQAIRLARRADAQAEVDLDRDHDRDAQP